MSKYPLVSFFFRLFVFEKKRAYIKLAVEKNTLLTYDLHSKKFQGFAESIESLFTISRRVKTKKTRRLESRAQNADRKRCRVPCFGVV